MLDVADITFCWLLSSISVFEQAHINIHQILKVRIKIVFATEIFMCINCLSAKGIDGFMKPWCFRFFVNKFVGNRVKSRQTTEPAEMSGGSVLACVYGVGRPLKYQRMVLVARKLISYESTRFCRMSSPYRFCKFLRGDSNVQNFPCSMFGRNPVIWY